MSAYAPKFRFHGLLKSDMPRSFVVGLWHGSFAPRITEELSKQVRDVPTLNKVKLDLNLWASPLLDDAFFAGWASKEARLLLVPEIESREMLWSMSRTMDTWLLLNNYHRIYGTIPFDPFNSVPMRIPLFCAPPMLSWRPITSTEYTLL